MKFWIPWSVAAVVTATCLYFFTVGLADGSVSSFNGGLWAFLLLFVNGVTGGSLWLKRAGKPGWATLLALVLAVPGVVAGLFLLIVVISNPRWN